MRLPAAVLMLLCLTPARAARVQAREDGLSPVRRSAWLWLLPGGGQFWLGQDKAGASYAAGTSALGVWAGLAELRRESGEINAPLVYAQQAYVTSAYAAYRDLRLRHAAATGAAAPARLDPSPVSSLAAAPFRAENIASPWVWGAAALGFGMNYAIGRAGSNQRDLNDIRRVRYLGESFNRDLGAAAYAGYWIPISLGAGVAEESLFRGVLQAEWEERWGPRTGLAAASGLFGLAHLARPADPESWAQVGFAAAAGAYLGWRFQRDGYRLARPVAAHFWYDVAAGLALFLADPAENPLGAKIRFAY